MEKVNYDLECPSSNSLTIFLTREKREIREKLYGSFGAFEQVVLDVDGEKHVYKADDLISILECFELPSFYPSFHPKRDSIIGGDAMSSVNGRLVTCDICGESVFLKCVGEGVTDGGYTKWNKFEEAIGWSRRCYEYTDICPSCTEKISNAVKDEIEGIKREKRSKSHDD